jgi:hypothetical protein
MVISVHCSCFRRGHKNLSAVALQVGEKESSHLTAFGGAKTDVSASNSYSVDS